MSLPLRECLPWRRGGSWVLRELNPRSQPGKRVRLSRWKPASSTERSSLPCRLPWLRLHGATQPACNAVLALRRCLSLLQLLVFLMQVGFKRVIFSLSRVYLPPNPHDASVRMDAVSRPKSLSQPTRITRLQPRAWSGCSQAELTCGKGKPFHNVRNIPSPGVAGIGGE